MLTFLTIPLELRLFIYDVFLANHQHVHASRQPSNAHFALLHTCKQIAYEAAYYRQYVSLTHEQQIEKFINNIPGAHASQILFADVANDGRIVSYSDQTVPVSRLYQALGKMHSLRRLRVFDCRRGGQTRDFIPGARLSLQFELAMFPSGRSGLYSYELYLEPSTQAVVFQSISPTNIQVLRLSGRVRFSTTSQTPALSHLAIRSVTSNHLDHRMEEQFNHSSLQSFRYAQGNNRMGSEITDRYFQSLVSGPGVGLRKLVLLGCSKLTSTSLASCLRSLPLLEYFALSFVTIHELRSGFITALPTSVMVFKLKISNAWYTDPLLQQETELCDELEASFLLRQPPPQSVFLTFRDSVLSSRGVHWRILARDSGYSLALGPWEQNENV
ncbi:uncharacterized protein EV420DRAFT_938512 [Desarmillaria tabescens]|uniref:F-box domain-containing protein n=1 Tax=Armillaria tabescens TaxID=1929756 RepID=A0AA39NG99_ARMTA|nr:uncharacterized protein EV420DRAFT_938512 [Desarmillaria tabescens]KAK0465097.1 hypothetical protein EV420DRAFT_938512 [Desarmillaria tabescens]